MSEGGDEVSERDSEREGRGWSEGGRGKGRHLVHPQHSGSCISGQFDSPELCQVEIPYPGSRYVFHGSCSFINVEATVLLPRLVTGVQLADHLHRLGRREGGGGGGGGGVNACT